MICDKNTPVYSLQKLFGDRREKISIGIYMSEHGLGYHLGSSGILAHLLRYDM